jgi:hypothetical protein
MRTTAAPFLFALLLAAGSANATDAISENSACPVLATSLSTQDILRSVSSLATAEGLTRPDGRPQGRAFWGRRAFTVARDRNDAFQKVKSSFACLGTHLAFADEATPGGRNSGSLTRYRVETYKLEGRQGPSISLGKFDLDQNGAERFVIDVQFYYLH